jgi:cyclophilin family peptidyl-prolyl cis-trans isomerase
VRRLTLLTTALALALAGCGDEAKDERDSAGGDTAATAPATTTTEAEPQAGGCKQVEEPAPKPDGGQEKPPNTLDADKTYRLVVKTNCGEFSIELDQKQAPKTSASLVSLAEKGFFDGTIFHRIVPDFVIQGGDPTASGSGGPGYSTRDKVPADATYTKGVVAMAKTEAEPPGTAGSQFYVVTGADAGLPPEYAVVGKVADGQDVVDRIGQLGDASEQPTQTVLIESMRVEES